eukprot:TRINITY_DN11904_c0_g1_i1.p1 TRINITY_DN11904_c0_g1~~TRINITY_DN11904_c0_g1_i1.p1  ORF type:complete len:515 (-),score=135.54 TRINITY_DN11904_c0_g1_i1:217-1704(-)
MKYFFSILCVIIAVILPETVFVFGDAPMLEGNDLFTEALNAALVRVYASNFNVIYEKYFPGTPIDRVQNCDERVSSHGFPAANSAKGGLSLVLINKEIVFGTVFNAPYALANGNLSATGFDVELAQAITQQFSAAYAVSFSARFVNVTRDAALAGLTGGLFDVAIGGLALASPFGDTSDAAAVNYTCSYSYDRPAVLRGPLDFATLSITSLADLNQPSVHVAVPANQSALLAFAAANFPHAVITQLAGDVVSAVLSGTTYHAALAGYRLLSYGRRNVSAGANVTLLGPYGAISPIAFVTRRNVGATPVAASSDLISAGQVTVAVIGLAAGLCVALVVLVVACSIIAHDRSRYRRNFRDLSTKLAEQSDTDSDDEEAAAAGVQQLGQAGQHHAMPQPEAPGSPGQDFPMHGYEQHAYAQQPPVQAHDQYDYSDHQVQTPPGYDPNGNRHLRLSQQYENRRQNRLSTNMSHDYTQEPAGLRLSSSSYDAGRMHMPQN